MASDDVRMTEQGKAAMREMGFGAVGLDEPGAPTPGRIADRLHDVQAELDAAALARDWPGVEAARAQLGWLLLAIDAWGAREYQSASG